MMREERRRRIVAELAEKGSATLTELAELLQVSTMTIRRDVDALAEDGTLSRTRGGVLLERHEPALRAVPQASAAKHAVAKAAAALIGPGDVVGIAAGVTTLLLASYLRQVENLTVVTNSLPIADMLSGSPPGTDDMPDRSVVITGGLRTPSNALVGPVTVRALEQLHCDTVIISGHGLAPETGLTTPNLLEAETNRALVASARRTVVVIDHTKWRKVSLRTIVDLDSVDVIVVDDGIGAAAVEELRGLVPEVQVVET